MKTHVPCGKLYVINWKSMIDEALYEPLLEISSYSNTIGMDVSIDGLEYLFCPLILLSQSLMSFSKFEDI